MLLPRKVHVQGSETDSVTDHLLGWQHKPKSIITSLINGPSLCTQQHGIHALTQQHMHQGRYDKHCIFLTPFFFFLCRNCNLNSIGVEPQRIIQSDESWDMIWARVVCGGMYSTSLHILYSHLRWREAHVRSEIWSWKGCQNGNIRASIHFPLWWKLRCESLVLVHY